jgi:glutamate synthase (NADPH/NADH) large chain
MTYHPEFRPGEGLYPREVAFDACGVGFVAHLKNRASHTIVEQGLRILENLSHRGASGARRIRGWPGS